MRDTRDRELDRILANDKPGFERVGAHLTGPRPRATPADGGTPDVAVLRAKGAALGIPHPSAESTSPRDSTGGRRSGPKARAGTDRTARTRGAASHHIVRVRHTRHDEADPLPSRVVVVSHTDRRIIGEQG